MEQFDQLLTCAICLDRYRNPKLLPCQHSFCMEPCMEGLVDYVRRQVKCPECRAEHRIPYQGVQGFPTNVTLQRFLELHIEITGELPDPTSGQVMERCNVCSEKAYCSACAHCEKKVCTDCKDAHMDVLKREIARINNQIRRTVHRLQDVLSLIEKNTLQLQLNCTSVTEEIDEIYRRLTKALKDRMEYLKGEIERYLSTEFRNLTTLKDNLEQEISNINSNCELAEKHMTENCSSNWDDCELMDTKDIFLRTVEFIRSFDYETGDYSRRVRFSVAPDPNQLVNTLAAYGDLTINVPTQSGGNILAPPAIGPGLMRSKSDHRLAAQFRQKEERGLYPYGEEEGSGRTSPLGGRRFGERYGSNRERPGHDSSRYGNRGEYGGDYETSYDSDGRRSRPFRSRFTRHLPEAGDSDNEPSGRSVRFSEQQDQPPRKEREKVLDTEDVGRGPLSGITRLFDSPRVIMRLQEPQLKEKKKDKEPVPKPVTKGKEPSQTPAWRRQQSEDDEITKIKKQNKEQTQAENTRVTALKQEEAKVESVRQRKVSASQQEEKSDDQGRSSHATTPTTTEKRHLPASRQSSNQDTPKPELPTSPDSDDNNVVNTRKRSTGQSSKTEEPETPVNSKWAPPAAKPYSRTSSGSSVNLEEADGSKAPARLNQERFKPRSNSSDSASSESSASSSHNTGAVFSADEVKAKYLSNIKEPPTATSKHSSDKDTSGASTPQSRYSSTSSTSKDVPERKDSISSVTSPTSRAPGTRFQSRFLGRAATPTAETSKELESSSSDSEDTSSASEVEPPTAKEKVPGRPSEREIEKSDIGALLARSANARDPSHSDRPKKDDYPSTSYSRSRGTASTAGTSSYERPNRDSPSYSSQYSPRERDTDRSDTYSSRDRDYRTRDKDYSSRDKDYSSRDKDYGSKDKDYSALARSRTGSTLYGSKEEQENSRYPLTSKYLSRSKTTTPDEEAPSSSRYGSSGYTSRFLNRSKSSAAIGPEKEEEEEEEKPVRKISGDEKYPSGRSRYAALKERRSRLARSRSSHDLGLPDDDDAENKDSPTSTPYRYTGSKTSMKSRENSPERNSAGTDKESLSSWARYLKNKYGGRNKDATAAGVSPSPSGQSVPSRSRSSMTVGLPSRTASIESSDDDQKNSPTSPTSPTTAGFGNLPRNQYLQKRRLLFKIGSRGSEPGCFTWPRGIAVGPDNYIVVADSSNHRVQIFDPSGNFHKEFGSYGNAEGEFDCLAGVSINRIGQYIIADRYNHRIQVFDPSGRFLRTFGSQGTADGKFNYPWGITTDALGFIYVCDKENHRVQVFQSDGTFVGKFGSMGNKPGQLEHPHYIAVSSTNRVIVSDSNNHRIQIFDVNGKVLTTFGSEGSEEGQFKFPRGVAVDDQGYIFVGDSGNNRIQIFHPDGTFLRAFGCWGSGDGEFKGLEGIAVMPNGNILLCDRENHRIQVF